jgi:hypothetical protein
MISDHRDLSGLMIDLMNLPASTGAGFFFAEKKMDQPPRLTASPRAHESEDRVRRLPASYS